MNEVRTVQWSIGLDGTTLKRIAVLSMVIDHITVTFLEGTISPETGSMMALSSGTFYTLDLIGRGVGRQAFPIFAFFIAEGYCKTHSRVRYLGRLVLFAVLSQLPYFLMCYTGPIGTVQSVSLNVYATLAFGLLAIWALDSIYLHPTGLSSGYYSGKVSEACAASGISVTESVIRCTAAIVLVCGICAVAWYLNTDYGFIGVISIVGFYLLRRYPTIAVFTVCVWLGCNNVMEWLALPGCLLLLLYNGKRGSASGSRTAQLSFYLFYPLHMIVLWGLRVMLFGG